MGAISTRIGSGSARSRQPHATSSADPSAAAGHSGGGSSTHPHYLTPREAADRLRISRSLIYEACADGSLAHYRVGRKGRRGKILIDPSDLDVWFTASRVGGQRLPAQPPPVPRPVKPTFRHLRL